MIPRPVSLLAATFLALVCAIPAQAGQRRFVYNYEATASPKGLFEFENWVTWKDYGNDGDNFQFRHEVEYGITDRLQISLYLADWSHDTRRDSGDRTQYDGSGVELLYNMTNPTTDLLGSALYGEVVVGDEVVKLEGKLILQKNFGPFMVAYNAIIEGEWEGEELDERNGELAQTFGVSYEVNKNFAVGAEFLHEVEFENWEEAGESIVFGGPNVSVRSGRVFATVAGLWQITDVRGEPEVQTRLIVGVDF